MSDIQLIESCVDLYYEGCCESDPSKIKEAFDEHAMISGYLPDGLHEMNLDELKKDNTWRIYTKLFHVES